MDKERSRKVRSFWSDLEKGSGNWASLSASVTYHSSFRSISNSSNTSSTVSRFGIPAQSIGQKKFVQSDLHLRQKQKHQTEQQSKYQLQSCNLPDSLHFQQDASSYKTDNHPRKKCSNSTENSMTSSQRPISDPEPYIQTLTCLHDHQTHSGYISTNSQGSFGCDSVPLNQNFGRMNNDLDQFDTRQKALHSKYTHNLPQRPSCSPSFAQNILVSPKPEAAFNHNKSPISFHVEASSSIPATKISNHQSIYATSNKYETITPDTTKIVDDTHNTYPTKSALKNSSPIQEESAQKAFTHKNNTSFFRKGSLNRLLNSKTNMLTLLPTYEKQSKKKVSFVRGAPDIIEYETTTSETPFVTSSFNDTEKFHSDQGLIFDSIDSDGYNTKVDEKQLEFQMLPFLQVNEDDSTLNAPITEPPERIGSTLLSITQDSTAQILSDNDLNRDRYSCRKNTQARVQSGATSLESHPRPLPKAPKSLTHLRNPDKHLDRQQFSDKSIGLLSSTEPKIKSETADENLFTEKFQEKFQTQEQINKIPELSNKNLVEPKNEHEDIIRNTSSVKVKTDSKDIVLTKSNSQDGSLFFMISDSHNGIIQKDIKNGQNEGTKTNKKVEHSKQVLGQQEANVKDNWIPQFFDGMYLESHEKVMYEKKQKTQDTNQNCLNSSKSNQTQSPKNLQTKDSESENNFLTDSQISTTKTETIKIGYEHVAKRKQNDRHLEDFPVKKESVQTTFQPEGIFQDHPLHSLVEQKPILVNQSQSLAETPLKISTVKSQKVFGNSQQTRFTQCDRMLQKGSKGNSESNQMDLSSVSLHKPNINSNQISASKKHSEAGNNIEPKTQPITTPIFNNKNQYATNNRNRLSLLENHGNIPTSRTIPFVSMSTPLHDRNEDITTVVKSLTGKQTSTPLWNIRSTDKDVKSLLKTTSKENVHYSIPENTHKLTQVSKKSLRNRNNSDFSIGKTCNSLEPGLYGSWYNVHAEVESSSTPALYSDQFRPISFEEFHSVDFSHPREPDISSPTDALSSFLPSFEQRPLSGSLRVSPNMLGPAQSASDGLIGYQKLDNGSTNLCPVSQLPEDVIFAHERLEWVPNLTSTTYMDRYGLNGNQFINKGSNKKQNNNRDYEHHNKYADQSFANKNAHMQPNKAQEKADDIPNARNKNKPMVQTTRATKIGQDVPAVEHVNNGPVFKLYSRPCFKYEQSSLHTYNNSDFLNIDSNQEHFRNSLTQHHHKSVSIQPVDPLIKQEDPEELVNRTTNSKSIVPLKAAAHATTNIGSLKAFVPATIRIKQEMNSTINTPPERTIPRFETHADACLFKERQRQTSTSENQRRPSSLAFETTFTRNEEEPTKNREQKYIDGVCIRPRVVSNISSHHNSQILMHRTSLNDLLPNDYYYHTDNSNPITDRDSQKTEKVNSSPDPSSSSTQHSKTPFTQGGITKPVLLSSAVFQEAQERYRRSRDTTPRDLRDYSSPLLQLAPVVPLDTPNPSTLNKVTMLDADSLGIYQQEPPSQELNQEQPVCEEREKYTQIKRNQVLDGIDDSHTNHELLYQNTAALTQDFNTKKEQTVKNPTVDGEQVDIQLTNPSHHIVQESNKKDPNPQPRPRLSSQSSDFNSKTDDTHVHYEYPPVFKREISPVGEFGFKNADAYDYEHGNQAEVCENDNGNSDSDEEENYLENFEVKREFEDNDNDAGSNAENDREEQYDTISSTIVARGTKMKARPSLIPRDVSVSRLIELNHQTAHTLSLAPSPDPHPGLEVSRHTPEPSTTDDHDIYEPVSVPTTNGPGRGKLPTDNTNPNNIYGHYSLTSKNENVGLSITDSTYKSNEPKPNSLMTTTYSPSSTSNVQDHSKDGFLPSISQPLLDFDVSSSASESLLDDLDKEFDRMFHESSGKKEKDQNITIDRNLPKEPKRHGYMVRENQDIVVATAEQRRRSQLHSNIVHSHRDTFGSHSQDFNNGLISEEISDETQRKVNEPLQRLMDSLDEDPESQDGDSVTPEEEIATTENPNEQQEKTKEIKARFRKNSEIFSNDRGRLFAKLVSLENIQKLPDIDTKNAKVCMILDNGLHSITTPYKPMHKSATALDHEFELVVGQTLEFILTLKVKWPKPKDIPTMTNQPSPHSTPLLSSPHQIRHATNSGSRVMSNASSISQFLKPTPSFASSATSTTSNRKRHGLSKLFSRNKGDKEKKGNIPVSQHTPTPLQSTRFGNTTHPQQNYGPPKQIPDPWEKYVAQDGSFARAYVSLSEYEPEIYGIAKTVSIVCYNEWTSSSVPLPTPGETRYMTEAIDPMTQRQTPYPIAKLVCELMYIPRGRADERLPGSILEAKKQLDQARLQTEEEAAEVAAEEAEAREMLEYERQEKEAAKERKELEEKKKKEDELNGVICESSLSQLGGDCRYWRRRYFKLNKATDTLTAYSETSHKPRVSINLKKAVRVIEDKNTLVEPTVDTVKSSENKKGKVSKGRRKSAFAEQEEGFMFVNEGFRVRFSNGEIIDFYADDQEQKRKWVSGLRQVIAGVRVKEAEERDREFEEERRKNEGANREIKQSKRTDKKKVEMKPWIEQVFAQEEEKARPEIREWRELKRQEREAKKRQKEKEEEEEGDTIEEKEEGDVQEDIVEFGYGEEDRTEMENEEEEEEIYDMVEDQEYSRIPVASVRAPHDRDSTATIMNDFIDGDTSLVLPKRNGNTNTMYI